MANTVPITVAYGDGVGPEILEACLYILQEARADINVESIEIGERIYRQGARDGILPGALPLLMRTGRLLLGPIVIPMHTKCEPLQLSLCTRFELAQSRRFDMAMPDVPIVPIVQAPRATFGYQTIGEHFALFSSSDAAEPKKAGKNTANPSAMLQAAMLMLVHIGQAEVAKRIYAAWGHTLSDGIHTKDIYGKHSREKAGTREFAEAVVARL